MRKAYELIPVDKFNDDEFKSLIDKVTTDVTGSVDDTAAKGGVFGKPSANNGGGTTTELSDAQIAAISRRDGNINADGQPF